MARIRSIKPEFWTSEQVVECSPEARLLFIGIWNFADDAGIHPNSEKQLKMKIFPGDDYSSENIRRMVGELSASGLLDLYEFENKRFLRVVGWYHQKIDKPTYKYPFFNGSIPANKEEFEELCSTSTRRVLTPGVEGRGVEGSGGEGKGITHYVEQNVKVDESEIPPLTLVDQPASPKPNLRKEAIKILSFLNEKTQRNFKPVDSNLNFITARLKEGYSTDELRQVIVRKTREWINDDQMSKFLRPETLFNKTKLASYSGELIAGE